MLKFAIARGMVNRQKRQYSLEHLEQKHVDLSLPFPNDSSFFYGGDKEGNAFITRMAFRGPDRKHEYWFDFFLKGKGFFGIKDDPGPDGPGFQMGSLKWEPEKPGGRWMITYDGPVKDEKGNIHACKADLIFDPEHPVYDYAESSDRNLIAKAIASRKWTRDFFLKLKELAQIHYEQTGRLHGTILLDGEKHDLMMRSTKDHSFGSRTWLCWDRHYWITGLADDGHQWTVTNMRWEFLDSLVAGFVIDPDGQADAIVEATSLEEVSSQKLLPDNAVIRIRMRSGKTHTIEFFRHGHFPYLMDESYDMFEAIGSYRFDGTPGLGMVEFGFRREKYKTFNF
jgi:hypothetical protein